MLRAVLGQRMSYAIYTAWQRWRNPTRRVWQLQRNILSNAVVSLPNSKAEAGQIKHDFRLSSKARQGMTIVPNAIDPSLFQPKPSPSSELMSIAGGREFVLEVGRVSPEKNSLALIEALWSTDIPIVFVGKPAPNSPAYVESCHERARDRGNVHFVEFMPHSELPRVYAAAAVHALPSWRETPGLASLEAAASGCRVVTTTEGSASEYFGDDAWYCQPDQISSIRTAVLAALDAPPSASLRERVLREFTWDAAATATLRGYHAALAA